MKKLFPIIAIVLLGATIWSCDEDTTIGEESPVYIVSNWHKKDSIFGGSHYFFYMDIHAVKGNLKELVMTAVDRYNGKRDLETIELSGTKEKLEYDFFAPIFPDSMVEMELRATVSTDQGDKWTGTKKLKVFADDYTLTEKEIALVENPAKGLNNAICFEGGKPEAINTGHVTETSKHHVVIAYDSNSNNNTASRAIRTYASNIRMSRMSFDYMNTTYNSLRRTFQERCNNDDIYTSIDNLKEDDIILIGSYDDKYKKGTALGIIKVKSVPTTNDQDTDKYIFLVKGMARN